MTILDIPLDDPDRLTAAGLLDEVMFGDHSNDSANAVIARALKDARRGAVDRLKSLADELDRESYAERHAGEDFDRGASWGREDAADRIRAALDSES